MKAPKGLKGENHFVSLSSNNSPTLAEHITLPSLPVIAVPVAVPSRRRQQKMGHITLLPHHILESIFSIYTVVTPDPSSFLFDDEDSQSGANSFERHLAVLGACCRKFAHVTRRLLWRELKIIFRGSEAGLRKRQVNTMLSIFQSSSIPTLSTPALEGGEGEGIGVMENDSLSTPTPLNDHAAEAIVSAVKTLNIEVGGDQAYVEWLAEVFPRLFRVLGARILHLKIDCSELELQETTWVLDVLFGAIEVLDLDPRTPKTLQTLEVLWPVTWFHRTPVQIDMNRFTKILADKFRRLRHLSLSRVRAVETTSQNVQSLSTQTQQVSGTVLPDWFEVTAPTLRSVRVAQSGFLFNEAALSVLARSSKNLKEFHLSDIRGPLTAHSMERLLTSNRHLRKLSMSFPYMNSTNATRLRTIWPRDVEKYDILAALARQGGSLQSLDLSSLDALGSCWADTVPAASNIALSSARIIQPSEPAVVWTNLVSLTLKYLPCFPGRLLELLAMAVNAKVDYRFPLKLLYIGHCPRVGSDALKALLRVSHELRYVRLLDLLPDASSDSDPSSTYISPQSREPIRKILVDNSVLDIIAESCPHLQDILFNNCTHVSQKATVMNMIRSCPEIKNLVFQGKGNPLLCESMEGEQPDISVRKGLTPDSFLITASGAGLEKVRNRMG
ncbi:hypothetical protein HK102_006882 [Quaeritorhiza haematococci]|nr:hypothetical protein HK102_006882 [Quaeritorhiza haematococci]